MPLFSSARLKLDRAKRLVAELEIVVNAWAATQPVKSEVTGANEVDGNRWLNSEMTFDAIPSDVSLLMGDIIHCTRTALDHMASELARLNDKSDKHVYFPFSEDQPSLKDQIKNKNFKRCGDEAVALLETFQPYRNGNEDLRAIHDLDVLDKHRALVPEPSVDFETIRAHEFVGEAFVKKGKLTRKVRFTEPRVSGVTLVFPTDSALADRPVVPALKDLVNLCEGVLEAFATLKLDNQEWVDSHGDLLAEPSPYKIIFFRVGVAKGGHPNPAG